MKTKIILKIICITVYILFSFIKSNAQQWSPSHKIGTLSGVYNFSYNQTPDQLTELLPAGIPNTGLSYQWEQSTMPLSGFTAISGATQTSYTFSAALSQTTYYRRKTTNNLLQFVYSNIIKITVVSVNWEDINYIREHDVMTVGITSWTATDQLPIGQKLQTTTYLDGLGRGTEKVSRETATPATPDGLWGDMVQYSQYDAYGRETARFLPYSTTTQSGKYKTAGSTEQPQYYITTYNETSAFSTITFDNSPLNRVMNVKQPGAAWAAANGNSANYDINTAADNVKIFGVDYIPGNLPVYKGTYPVATLYKLTYADENGKKVIEFINKSGQLILKKVQLDNIPADEYNGWICTYNIYDDFGLLRFQIQPEGVKYLSIHNWILAGLDRNKISNEQLFQYSYDDKGRTIWKKTPGAAPLKMLYDSRGRIIFMQDGNQALLPTPQWTANLYDELDRPVLTTLYNTSKTIDALQADINNAVPISPADLSNNSVCTVLKYLFYDDYSFAEVKSFDNNFINTLAYNAADPNVIPIAKTLRTTSMPTGSRTRVLGTEAFLSATHYYDERGALVQTLESNIKNGTDITTLQYHFDGRVLSSCNSHTASGTGYTNFKTLTKYLFDKLGRVTSIQKQFGSNPLKTISSYDYDDMGRVKTKHLDPSFSPSPGGDGGGLESLSYSFNIHNQITGINKDYALKTPGSYNKWSHFFGLYLGFDNKDNVFANANLTGQVTGQLWSTQGDDAQRKYDYIYDNAGRLVNAAFNEKQHTSDAWSNATMDFSISGTSGKITYDLNGNLLTMLHKGVVPGTAAPITVDDLRYTYATYSNKLKSVTDNMTSTAVNGTFGDFKDGENAAAPDYVYDANGNVVTDLNKNAKELNNVAGANGIKYNFLDKPEEIRITGKGVIKIVYSAAGEKLQRKFTPEAGSTTITTTYINQYVYQDTTGGATELQFINFEEGRIRIITPTAQGNGLDALTVDGNMDLPDGKRGAYDYYIMDYQQNVRMILTEEQHAASNTATMETNRSTLEESIFGQTGTSNEVAATRYTTPPAWTANTTASVSRLGTGSGHNIGPNTLQKVMAGDKVSATVQYYYQNAAGGNNAAFLNTVANSLLSSITGSNISNSVKGNATTITNGLSSANDFVNAVQPNGSNPAGNTPQAYLTVLFFDERFNLVPAADGGVAQQQVEATVSEDGATLVLPNIKAPKNGYAYVYISNQSNNDVYFDDFKVGIVQGNIAEENHYYAYGLKIATLSSKKLGDVYEGALKNNYLYNGKEFFDDADLGWYDYGFRNYDPQIGRFTQLDPLTDSYPYYTPYQFAGCEPIANVDLDGLEPLNVIGHVGDAIVTANSAMAPVILGATKVGKVTKSLSLSSKIGFAVKMSNVINSNFISESTCQNCGASRNVVAEAVNKPEVHPQLKQGRESTPQEKSATEIEAKKIASGENYENYKQEIIRKQNIEDVENSASKNLPLVDNLVKAGRYKLKYGYDNEALSSVKDLAVEVAEWYVLGKAVGAGLKFIPPAGKGMANVLKPLGLGSTGRTTAANLAEQIAIKNVMANPQLGTRIMEGMKDSRWLGWTKMEYKLKTSNGINVVIHYVGKWENGVLKAVDDFKFK